MYLLLTPPKKFGPTPPKKLMYFFVHFCLFWYWYYYPHQSRDSVSPICGIFFCLKLLDFLNIGATIRTRREIQFLLYILLHYMFFLVFLFFCISPPPSFLVLDLLVLLILVQLKRLVVSCMPFFVVVEIAWLVQQLGYCEVEAEQINKLSEVSIRRFCYQ